MNGFPTTNGKVRSRARKHNLEDCGTCRKEEAQSGRLWYLQKRRDTIWKIVVLSEERRHNLEDCGTF